jgi:molybdenum cofactor cytidylyltransferase
VSVGAVLLAAGAGSRLGGKPKCLLELDGTPLVVRQLSALETAGVDQVVVVLGYYAELIEPVIRNLPIKVVVNLNPENGQASSVRLGLQNLSGAVDSVIIALADQPLIDSEDVSSLIAAYARCGKKSMVVPRKITTEGEKKPGNPVMIDAALRDQWLAGDAEMTSRNWRQKYPETVFWFEPLNDHWFIDIDEETDIVNFEARTGRLLQWPDTVSSVFGKS